MIGLEVVGFPYFTIGKYNTSMDVAISNAEIQPSIPLYLTIHRVGRKDEGIKYQSQNIDFSGASPVATFVLDNRLMDKKAGRYKAKVHADNTYLGEFEFVYDKAGIMVEPLNV